MEEGGGGVVRGKGAAAADEFLLDDMRRWPKLGAGESWADASDASEAHDLLEATREAEPEVKNVRSRWGKGQREAKGEKSVRGSKEGRTGGGSEEEKRRREGEEEEEREEEATSVQEVTMPEVYQYPKLPRKILEGRMAALEARGQRLGDRDARVQRCAELQEETRKELQAAGGRSLGRLVFGLVEGEKDIKRWASSLQKARAELEEAELVVQRKGKMVEVAQVRLSNARAMQTNRGFQVAAEMAGHTGGYDTLEAALFEVQQALIDGGDATARAAPAFQQVQYFVQSFATVSYSEKDDPLLRQFSSDSEATHSERDSTETVVYCGQLGQAGCERERGVAAGVVQEAAKQAAGEGSGGRGGAVGAPAETCGGGAGVAGKGGRGEAEAAAFKKAALVPVPNSDGSGGSAAPLPKRSRGSSYPVPRAAPWVGGPTGDDVGMPDARRGTSGGRPAQAVRMGRTAARGGDESERVGRCRTRSRDKGGRGRQMLAICDRR